MTWKSPPRLSRRATRRRQAGYALLMVIFLGALMLIAVAAVAPNILTQGRREREEEMIWRGNQYVRAIRSYYRKNGRFPTSIDDLAEKKQQIRFLRQRYPDPMNRADGKWRFIYIGPGGQLIGSLTRTSAIQLQGGPGAPGVNLLQPGKGPIPTSGFGQPAAAGQPVTPPPGQLPGESGPVIGGNIIGVASKVNKTSLKAYNGRTNYREWEFIWDPTKDASGAGRPGFPGAPPVPTNQPGQPIQPPRQP